MAMKPSVLFLSSSSTHPDEIIKFFLNASELPEKIYLEKDIYGFPYVIDNKYYTAEVNLCSIPDFRLLSDKLGESVQAVVLHFDSSTENALEKVEKWLPLINLYEPEIKILVTENVPNDEKNSQTSCSKRKILEWCIAKTFELVELNPIIDHEDNELENDFFETVGVERIIQALNAHVWPNLVMKSSTPQQKLMKTVNSVQKDINSLRDKLCLEKSLEEMLENEDDFSQLFSQLSEMKAKVSSLSGSDKKDAAEQIVKAFWKALGEDDEEFLYM